MERYRSRSDVVVRMNRLESLKAYGAKCGNTLWSWSARTADGEVVLFLWQNLIRGNGRG